MVTVANGSTPQINRSGETPGPKRLFHSVRDIALIKDKTIDPGYGVVLAGTAMGVSTVNGNLVPYVPIGLAAYGTLSVAPALADVPSGVTISVPLSTIKRFVVGENLIIVHNNAGTQVLHDGGAIVSAVKASEYSATITFTTTTGDTDSTVAAFASCYVESQAATPFSKAVYILDKDTDTGEGEDAKGANVSVVISNAILYTTSLINVDAAALTDLGAITDGQHTILK